MKNNFSTTTLLGIEAALLAGEVLRRGFGTHFSIMSKPEGQQNLVTEYDRLSEQTIIQFIRHHLPSSHFLAEESGMSGEADKETLWVIDPLDGTVNFAHGIPVFSVSIGICQKNQLVGGIIYQPMTRELFVAEKGKGAFLNGSKIGVSKVSVLRDSFFTSGVPYNLGENPGQVIEKTGRVLRVGSPIRFLGSAAVDLAYTAAGRFEAFFEVTLAPWDVAAGVILLQEAGGEVTHWDQSPYDPFANKSILATNGAVHRDLSKILCS